MKICEVCGEVLTPHENAVLDLDVDFVSHGEDTHFIRRVNAPCEHHEDPDYCRDCARIDADERRADASGRKW